MMAPNEKWRWFIDENGKKLMVEMESGFRFETAYQGRQLAVEHLDLPFDIDHSQSFMAVVDEIESSGVPFSNYQVTQIALNASAAIHFHTPLVNKSFLYQRNSHRLDCASHRLAWLVSGEHTALVLTLQQDGESVTCLNLSEDFVSNDAKTHSQFCLIKVLSDRLISLDALEEVEQMVRQAC